jgi:hypothetical protein
VPARAGEQHVVRGQAAHELQRVLCNQVLLPFDPAQILQPNAMRMRHRLEEAAPVAPSPAGMR